jgi:peptidylprolyl isomerase
MKIPISARAVATVLTLVCSACSLHRTEPTPAGIPAVAGDPHVAFALREVDIQPGTGQLIEPRHCLYVNYTGWLTSGKKFDSSRDTTAQGKPGEPIAFPLGARRVIAGWDLGFEGMRVGGQRRLFIPYQLAYGEAGRPPVIPPRSELIFDVEVMAMADTLPRTDTVRTPRGQPAPPPRCPTWQTVNTR